MKYFSNNIKKIATNKVCLLEIQVTGRIVIGVIKNAQIIRNKKVLSVWKPFNKLKSKDIITICRNIFTNWLNDQNDQSKII